MAEAIVRPPNPDDKGYIHTDGGQALRHIRVSETSWPLQLKVQYFLTDLPKPGSGNFTLFPGSHLRPYPEGDNPVNASTPGAVQLCAEAGDAVVFTHSLWHGVSTNHSRRARKSLIYCYSQMCFRTFDFNGHAPDLLDRCTPRQRRLLGDLNQEWRPAPISTVPKIRPRSSQGRHDGRRGHGQIREAARPLGRHCRRCRFASAEQCGDPLSSQRRSVTRGTTSQVSWYHRSRRSRSSASTSR